MSLFQWLFHRKSDSLPLDGPFSLEAFCDAYRQHGEPWRELPASSREFLRTLNLSSMPPLCGDSTNSIFPPDVPPMGPLITHDHPESTWGAMVSGWQQVSPALFAFGGLWSRVFASVVAPLCIAHLLWDYTNHQDDDEKSNARKRTSLGLSCLLGVSASLVLTTDEMYCFESGPQYGLSLLVASSLLAFRASLRHGMSLITKLLVCLLLLTAYIVYDPDSGNLVFGGDNFPHNIQEGLYYNSDNSMTSLIAEHWPLELRTYSKENGATPWMITGDARTGLPFFLNHVEKPKWTRVWMPTLDNEVVGLDVAFPKSGYDSSKPTYLVLHGLNGGSEEKYVKDLANRRTQDGSTVVVMVARGLMDLPIMGWNVFHGARVDDVFETARVLRAVVGKERILVGVGFSMGAIVLNNYVARSGEDCALDAAMSISGGLDILPTLKHERAMRLWQPMLAQEMRERFIFKKFGERYKQRLTPMQMLELKRATNVTGIDENAVVAYNGFSGIEHYYSEMSAMGFRSLAESESGVIPDTARIHNVSIPLCVMHALEDPLLTWKTVASNHGHKHPENLVKTGSGNLMLLLTKSGGHVGWPIGWNPSKHQWKWMSDAAKGFVESVVQARSAQEARKQS